MSIKAEREMKKFIIPVCSVLISLVLSTNLPAFESAHGRAQMMPERARQHDAEGFYALYAKLNLTSEQKARIKALRDAYLHDIKPLQDQMFSKRGDLKLLWLQDKPDKDRILATQREIRTIRDQMQDKAIAHRVDIVNILTPEQQEKVRAALLQRGFATGMGDRHMMGPGGEMMGH
jgi:Spy/CpxP family protein refolding chaperone